ncbi:MAG TPA: hypothetical protein PK854_08745 [Oscillospiraceae bacterium]|nr:hypothetical protein [Oscillospiraceae bacterium]HPS35340.1 hypothetical protein [Oscillospiraceae bacterium]
MKKIRFDEVILVLIYMVVGFSGLFFGVYTAHRAQLAATATAFYGADARALMVSYKISPDEIDSKLFIEFARSCGDITIFNGSIKSQGNVWHGIYSSKPDFIMSVTSGRRFTATDFANLSTVAVVIGSNQMSMDSFKNDPNFEKKEGQLYFKGYQVIGELIVNTKNISSSGVIRIMSEGYTCQTGIFVLDAGDALNTNKRFDELMDYLKDHELSVEECELPQTTESISKFFGVKTLNLLMIGFCIFAVIISTVPITAMWAQRRFREIAVRRLIGANVFGIFLGIGLRLFLLYNLGFFAAYGIEKALETASSRIQLPGLLSESMLIAYFSALGVSILTALIPMIRCMAIEPGDALRKD